MNKDIEQHLKVIVNDKPVIAKHLLVGHRCINCRFVGGAVSGKLTCSFTFRDDTIKVCKYWKERLA
jgi:hypothetical protein